MRLALLLAAAVILIRDPTGNGRAIRCSLGFSLCRARTGCIAVRGHPLDDGEWDIKNNKYRVFIQGEWIVVPDDAVISGPNKFGKAIVWLQDHADLASGEIQTITRIRCFIPGSGV